MQSLLLAQFRDVTVSNLLCLACICLLVLLFLIVCDNRTVSENEVDQR